MRVGIYYLNYRLILEWIILSQNSLNIEFIVYIDWVSIIFIRIIFLISSFIIVYRYIYINKEIYFKRFIYLVIIFIISIILIIIRPNGLRILFGWDGLGLTSYLLVIYYQNFRSFNSGIVTVLCNRIGDIGILIFIRLLIIKGRWDFWIINKEGGRILVLIILILSGVTKRAQIPFSIWLPLAIAAPTPVSSLVHSSTLVTAGVYLIIRFNEFLNKIKELRILLFFISILTIFISRFIANFENDLKKIIALSTLSQLGLIIIVLRLGFKNIAFYHLLTHAIFKSMLFICVGILIHFIINRQDIRLYGNLRGRVSFVFIRLYIGSLALCGTPFIAGFYSKDIIVELILVGKINNFILLIILLSLVFTVSYTVRLIYYIFFGDIKFYRYSNVRENKLINKSIIVLIILRIIVGRILNWIFFFDLYIIYLSLVKKLIILSIYIMGIIIGFMVVRFNFLKIYYLRYYFRSIWFINSIYNVLYNPLNIIGIIRWEVDKTWIEFLLNKSLKNLIIDINKNITYKIYIFILLYVISMILLFLLI